MLAAAAAAASSADRLLASPLPTSRGANERLGVALVGVRGRGQSHLAFFAGRRDTQILYVCDVDRRIGMLRAAEAGRRQQGATPRWVEDMRHALEDPRVDLVCIATPHHWHALATLWALQAGKDVYVEKPVSHNVGEGRWMVEAARRHQRICQSGFQARSNPGMRAALRYVHEGGIGRVQVARGFCCKPRRPLRLASACPPPPDVNFDLWLGPAPAAPLARQQFHYDWHWQWSYGNGELGNQGVHQLDICRWALQLPTTGQRVFSLGGDLPAPHLLPPDNAQLTWHDFGDKSIIMELRGLAHNASRGARVGVIVEGSDGYLVTTGHQGGTVFDLDGRPRRHFVGGGGAEPHLCNFLEAVRHRACHRLHADIEEGHLSSVLAHTANISYRLGVTASWTEARRRLAQLADADKLAAAVDRTEKHLRGRQNDAPPKSVRLGSVLAWDPDREVFVGDEQADGFLTRSYRPPFVPVTGRA